MAHSYRLLVDENVEPIASDLRARGHDVVRLETVPELGKGADDRRDVAPFLRRTGRVVLTYDSHFTGEDSVVDPTTLPGVLFVPDETPAPNDVVRIIDVVATAVSPVELDGHVLHVTRHWLAYE